MLSGLSGDEDAMMANWFEVTIHEGGSDAGCQMAWLWLNSTIIHHGLGVLVTVQHLVL
jgi:hypothetical protein